MLDKTEWIDISYPIKPEMVIYPGNPIVEIERVQDIYKGDNATVSRISLGSHTGTHIDAPAHFIRGGATLDQISLDRINGKAKVFDVTGHCDIDIEIVSKLPIGIDDIILFKTDNSVNWNCNRILDDYVTLTYEAAQYLAERSIKLVGVDYLTIERPRNKRISGKSVHEILLGNGVLIAESLNLENTDSGIYSFICLPLNIEGTDGCPARCVVIKEVQDI